MDCLTSLANIDHQIYVNDPQKKAKKKVVFLIQAMEHDNFFNQFPVNMPVWVGDACSEKKVPRPSSYISGFSMVRIALVCHYAHL